MTDVETATRREHVLETALVTFARYGYKKASMEDVARAADISRPGLYFLFASKQKLFQAAATHALDRDVDAAEQVLADPGRPLRDRLIEAFDRWTGRYVGPIARDAADLIEAHPELLGPLVAEYPGRFRRAVTRAVAGAEAGRDDRAGWDDRAEEVAGTLLSTAAGIKHDALTREEFVARMTIAVDLYVRNGERS